MKRLIRYARALLLVEEGVPWFLPVMGTVILSLLVSFLFELLRVYSGLWAVALFLALLLLVGVIFIAAYDYHVRRVLRARSYELTDRPSPPQCEGLVILVGARQVLERAIEYHLPRLKHCWMISTPEFLKIAAQVQEKYKGRLQFHLLEIANEYDTDGCFDLVKEIFSVGAMRHGLAPEQLIADITGGTKPMTAAMVVACLDGGYAIEHIPAQFRWEGGRRVPVAPLDPIQIVIHRRAAGPSTS